MAVIKSKSSRRLLERLGLMPTFNRPAPIFDATRSLIHVEQLPTPMPIVSTIVDGHPPPDHIRADDPWPHGNCSNESA